ncbi:DNA mismatch endonuclease Vsr [Dokdonella sp.]|uniref:very short patch repair endonuclease n=1 Tax=Dokdonella sp. TaxID=2291710 RepID=UPI002C8D8050|nr:DNA mismatch endonuclease Vsr [Dokdonella sp.]HPN78228.1 DNA mismatch endonuclease Vsr [Dokdonella sp.]
MVDVVDKATRSRMMSGIRGRDTKPEKIVRSHLHRLGLRFRLKSLLPGKPDLVFPKYRTVVFVHGCFWHRHPGCKFASTPASNLEFWLDKFEANVIRDARAKLLLRRLDWRHLVVWECQLDHRRLDSLYRKIIG